MLTRIDVACSRVRDSRARWIESAKTKIKWKETGRVPFTFASSQLSESLEQASIDVKFIFDSVLLGLSSSANILQIADFALRVVFFLFLPCF